MLYLSIRGEGDQGHPDVGVAAVQQGICHGINRALGRSKSCLISQIVIFHGSGSIKDNDDVRRRSLLDGFLRRCNAQRNGVGAISVVHGGLAELRCVIALRPFLVLVNLRGTALSRSGLGLVDNIDIVVVKIAPVITISILNIITIIQAILATRTKNRLNRSSGTRTNMCGIILIPINVIDQELMSRIKVWRIARS